MKKGLVSDANMGIEAKCGRCGTYLRFTWCRKESASSSAEVSYVLEVEPCLCACDYAAGYVAGVNEKAERRGGESNENQEQGETGTDRVEG